MALRWYWLFSKR